ncbi:MAG: AEC family transporter [Cryobacterium sp.]|nr:AEC family transporter [Oligoflexia bacterium]
MEIFGNAVFTGLLGRLIPLYLIVALGFVAGRFLKLDRDSVAKLVIYLVSPIVVFVSVSQIDLKPEYLLVPLGFGLLSSGVAGLFLWLSHRMPERFGFGGPTGNLLAFAAGDANTGYFGLPVALMLFGADAIGIYLLFSLGFILYENTVGFYILARGKANARDALRRVLRLPAIYAFAAALLANRLGLKITGTYADFAGYFRGTYSVLGVMLIGLGVAGIRTWRFDWKFVSAAFLGKFFVWPVLIAGLIAGDRSVGHFYDERAHQMFFLIACTPLAANTVAFATLLEIEPAKAGVAVLLSTLFALFFIPAMAGWLL